MSFVDSNQEMATPAAANAPQQDQPAKNFFDQFDSEAQAAPAAGPAEAKPPPVANFFDQFDTENDAGEAGLKERARLNATDSFYRGTIAGSLSLSHLAEIAKRSRNGEDVDTLLKAYPPGPAETEDARREWLKKAPEDYDTIVNDLARYDLMRPWGTTAEAAVAFAGQLGGALPTPENFIGFGARGATLAMRSLFKAGEQGAIQLATDPVVQSLSIKSNVQREYEPLRTMLAPVMGAVIGGGLHVGGELVGQWRVQRQFSDMAAEDPQFRSGSVVPAEDVHAEMKRLVEETERAGALRREPPVPEGYVRFYHGYDDGTLDGEGSRWVTPDRNYAANFRGQKSVAYVDIPQNDPTAIALRAWDEIDEQSRTNMVGRYQHGEIPEEWAKKLTPLERSKPMITEASQRSEGEASGQIGPAEQKPAAGIAGADTANPNVKVHLDPKTGKGWAVNTDGSIDADHSIDARIAEVRALGSPLDVANKWVNDPEDTTRKIDDLVKVLRAEEKRLREKYGVRKTEDLDDAPLTAAERNFVFYASDMTDPASWRELSSQLQPIDSLDEAATELRYELRRLPRDPKNLGFADQMVLARLQVIFSEVQRLGGDLDQIVREAGEQYAARFRDPDDAAFMAKNAADELRTLLRGDQTTGAFPAISAPAAKAKPVGKEVPAMPAHRVVDADGRSIDVLPVVVEASSLRTSADTGYDASLQPRQRERAASQQQIREMASGLDPERLGFSSEADRGAPIIGDDLMVESGNGRVMAVRSAYEAGGEAAQRYRDWLVSQGVDIEGFRQPVLVRQRLTDLPPEERRAFTVSANRASTLTLSASERAMADSRLLNASMLEMIRNPSDISAVANRDFVRAFVQKLPQAEQGALTTADGGLSSEGASRLRNAILGAAYGDTHVLTRITEATSDEVRSISNALVAAAPEWAKLRADVRAGTVRPDMDLTPQLVEAIGRTADLRAKNVKLSAYLAQQDAFDQLAEPVAAFMRMFYDPAGRKAAGQQRITDALNFYSQEARKVTEAAGLDLGLPPVTASDLQTVAAQRSLKQYANGQQEGLFLVGRRPGHGPRAAAPGQEISGQRPGEAGRGLGASDERATGAVDAGRQALYGDAAATVSANGAATPDNVRLSLPEFPDLPTPHPKAAEIFARTDAAAQGDELALAARRGGERLRIEQSRPEEGVSASRMPVTTNAPGEPREAAPTRQGEIRSLQQQAFDFADAIGFPLRQGRNRAGTLGTYNRSSGVVRVKEVPDFEAVAHEAGHAIEAKAGQALTDLTERFPHELKPLVPDPAAYDPSQYVKEGFAEWIRMYIGNPVYAERTAPSFAAAFRDFMARAHPDMLRAIDNAGAAYRAYLEAPSGDVVAAIMRTRDDYPEGWRKVLKQVREEGFPAVYRSMMERAYTAILDDKAPVARAVREMAKAIRAQTGAPVELKAADNPEVLLRLFARTEQAAVRDMIDGVRPYRGIEPEGPSLNQAISKAAGDPTTFGRWDKRIVEQFSHYLIARRGEVLWDRFNRGELQNPPMALSKGDVLQHLQELEQAFPTFREASDMVHAYTRQILRKMYEGNLIGTDLYEKLLRDPFYVPFMRDVTDKPLANGDAATRGSADRVADVVQRMRGSSRDIKDPLESLMMQTFLVNRTVRHNDIIRTFVALSERAGPEGGRYVEKIPAYEARKYTFDLGEAMARVARERGVDPNDVKVLMSSVSDVLGDDPLTGSFFRMEPAGKRGEPLVFYKEGGEMKAARFMSNDEGHALYETLTSLPGGLQDLGLQVLSASSGLLRAGIVTNYTYALTNYFRDQVAAFLLRPDYFPFVTGAKGVYQEVTQAQSAKLYGYSGGVSAGASVAPLHQAAEADLNALAKKGYLITRLGPALHTATTLKDWKPAIQGLLEFVSVAEAGTRNSVFDKVFRAKQKQGLSDYEAMIEAGYSSQDVLDFSRHGSKTQAVIALTPFINSQVQGLDKWRRTAVQPILDRIRDGKLFATDQAEFNNALLTNFKTLGLFSVLGAAWAAIHQNDRGYQDASSKIKATHFVTSFDGKLFVIPKPFELSLGFTAGEYAFQRFWQNDPRAAEQFAEAAWEVLVPPVPIGANPLIKTSAELALGKSFFTGRSIVPDALERLEPAQQYNDRTSSLAKMLGQQINLSPMKIEHAIGGYFGLWGRDVMAMASGIDGSSPVADWQDRVFFRRFIKDPTRTSDITTKFWSFMGQTTGKYNQAVATYDNFLKTFRDPEAKQFLTKLPDNQRVFVTLRSGADEDGKAAFKADEKRLHPLQRSYDAVTLLNGVRRELTDNSFRTFENGRNVPLDPAKRGQVIDIVRELAQAEMFNALQIIKEPGYGQRPLVDTLPIMQKLESASPLVAGEVKTRYATSKIYKASAVALAFPKLQAEVLRDGSEADLGDMAADAASEGYEFGGERVKKPQKRRVTILPSGRKETPPAAPMQ